jgi:hypothetical protein
MTSVKELVRSGVLQEGQRIVWNRRVIKETHFAIINSDGSITTFDGVRHKSPSGAAKHLNGNKPVDGWLAWKIEDSGKSLGSLRS